MRIMICALLIVINSGIIAAQSADSIIPPSYIGGKNQLFSRLFENIKYPNSAKYANISGIVYISAIIDTNGILDSLWIVKGADKRLNIAAVDAVRKLGKWNPAMINTNPVRAMVNIPIGFYLGKNSKSVMIQSIYNQSIENIGYSLTLDEFMVIEYMESLSGIEGNYSATDDDFEVNYQRGIEALGKGDYELALEYFNKVYRGDPQNVDILFNRALANYKLGNLNKACRDWSRAAKLGDIESSELLKKHCEEYDK